MVFWLLPRTPGYVNGPRSVAENHREMWAAPEALPRRLDVRGQAIPINYITYYCRLLLIIDYYYLELCIDPLWWKNDNTRRDQIDICNMAHETNKAMSDQSNTLWLAGGEGDQGSTTFFYRHFSSWWSGASVFILAPHLQSHICALLKCAFQDNTRYTKWQIFYTIIETWSHRLWQPQ